MKDRLDKTERRGCLYETYVFPGRIVLWFRYMNPEKGELWKSSRQAKSPLYTFLTATGIYITLFFLVFFIITPSLSTGSIDKTRLLTPKTTKTKSFSNDTENNKKNKKPTITLSSETLKTKTYRNGDLIFHAQSKDDWIYAKENKIGAFCYYKNDPQKGLLYNRFAVNDPRKITPDGYHIPNEEEWKNIEKSNQIDRFLNDAGGMRKSSGKFTHYGKNAYYWIAGNFKDNNNMRLKIKNQKFIHEGDLFDNSGEGYSVKYVLDY